VIPTGEILDACCGGRHWWWDKAHPLAVYMDSRTAPRGCCDVRPNFEVAPDIVGDFRAMPFADGAFRLVVFDPPHNVRDRVEGYVGIKYGALPSATEQDDLRRGFAECWRVLGGRNARLQVGRRREARGAALSRDANRRHAFAARRSNALVHLLQADGRR